MPGVYKNGEYWETPMRKRKVSVAVGEEGGVLEQVGVMPEQFLLDEVRADPDLTPLYGNYSPDQLALEQVGLGSVAIDEGDIEAGPDRPPEPQLPDDILLDKPIFQMDGLGQTAEKPLEAASEHRSPRHRINPLMPPVVPKDKRRTGFFKKHWDNFKYSLIRAKNGGEDPVDSATKFAADRAMGKIVGFRIRDATIKPMGEIKQTDSYYRVKWPTSKNYYYYIFLDDQALRSQKGYTVRYIIDYHGHRESYEGALMFIREGPEIKPIIIFFELDNYKEWGYTDDQIIQLSVEVLGYICDDETLVYDKPDNFYGIMNAHYRSWLDNHGYGPEVNVTLEELGEGSLFEVFGYDHCPLYGVYFISPLKAGIIYAGTNTEEAVQSIEKYKNISYNVGNPTKSFLDCVKEQQATIEERPISELYPREATTAPADITPMPTQPADIEETGSTNTTIVQPTAPLQPAPIHQVNMEDTTIAPLTPRNLTLQL